MTPLPNSAARTRPAWGKYDQASGSFHRLEHHCADVAACFESLAADPVLRRRFAVAAGGELDAVTESRLAVLAFLHDFGKLNAGFQFKVHERSSLPPGAPPPLGHIEEAFHCTEQAPEVCEALGLRDILAWGDGAVELLLASLSHHGRPAQPPSGSRSPSIWQPFDGYDPRHAAALMRSRIRTWFPEAFGEAPPLPGTPALVHLFAGIVALADHIGSDKEVFRFKPDADENYIDCARSRAKRAIGDRGFRRASRVSRASQRDFRSLFGHERPRPLQQAVADAFLDKPLLILESETGSGKTEAAVMRFAALWRAGIVDGLYFALPTRAAAKQIHRRVGDAMAKLFPDDARIETVLALPGYIVAGEVRGRPIGDFQVCWEDHPDEAQRAARWSAESSLHFLSATAAVGTVDQALLGALKVKWAHLRGASLGRSLLVVDEVHASDAYMTDVLRALLRGHLDLGGHALLMSATLGASARSRLTSRSARLEPPTLEKAEAIPYPALTIAGRGAADIRPIAKTGRAKTVAVRVEPIMGDAARIAALALSCAKDGAKVLVVRNTVANAQATFEALVQHGGSGFALAVEGVPTLHHSRFAAEDRQRLDDAVEQTLGKNGRSVGGRVVIGTQTLEQSLDIDADLLISDLCPVDVLLQRIGRLHRHEQGGRPEAFRSPCAVILSPSEGLEAGIDGGLTQYGLGMSEGGIGVYRNLLAIEQTRRLVVDHPIWCIPDMNRMLVERATHPMVLGDLAERLGGQWRDHYQRNWGVAAAEAGIAREHALDREKPFENLAFPNLDEDVRTRLGDDGPRIELAEAEKGPFGKPVRTFNLPAHFFRGEEFDKEQVDAACLERTDDAMELRVGERVFPYSRLGIRRNEAISRG